MGTYYYASRFKATIRVRISNIILLANSFLKFYAKYDLVVSIDKSNRYLVLTIISHGHVLAYYSRFITSVCDLK